MQAALDSLAAAEQGAAAESTLAANLSATEQELQGALEALAVAEQEKAFLQAAGSVQLVELNATQVTQRS